MRVVTAAGASADGLARLGVAELPKLVASDLTTLSVCDLVTGRRRVIGDPGCRLSAEDIAAFDRHFFDHPLVRFHAANPAGGTHRISDSVGSREFRKSALYNEYYRPIGIDHAVAMPLYVDGTTLVSFVLNRAGREFGDDEIAVLDRLRGWLAAMYRNALALERAAEAMAQLRDIARAEDWAVVRIDGRRRIRELSRPALAMLAGAFPGTRLRAAAPLPAPIDAWLRQGAASAAPRLALAPLVLQGPAGSLTVRALPELGGDAAWLLLVRGESVGESHRAAPTAGLTPREQEVLDWVAAGKSDRQIAAILGASPRTVQKHLEHVYVKLGVENRTAAAMRARMARPSPAAPTVSGPVPKSAVARSRRSGASPEGRRRARTPQSAE
jgi:DNA-binding CsgD family transcriptional regulator